MRSRPWRFPVVGLVLATFVNPALAANCGGSFDGFIETFKREAAAKGISPRTVSIALSCLTPDPSVVALDRQQSHFGLSFEQFPARASPAPACRRPRA